MLFFLLIFIPLAAMLIGLPLLGAWWTGLPLGPYLEFPPRTRFILHADFSWAAFGLFSTLILVTIWPVVSRAHASYRLSRPTAASASHCFPWWGWAAITAGVAAWIAAWTRFPALAPLQSHTFTPLWLAYIGVVNALCLRRTGQSLMTHQTRFFAALFPASALFWWFFEFLNRFVQNWYYVGERFSAWSYFWFATLPFATVLPAVLSTQELIRSFDGFRRSFGSVRPLAGFHHPLVPWAVLGFSAAGLTGIAAAPSYFFPLVWVAPLLLLVALLCLGREPHVLQALGRSDWTGPASAALAALLCGFFWEMWNFFSLTKWKYSIPFVQRFEIFEMPILGYFGYLPFGLECAIVGEILQDLLKRNRGGFEASANDIIL
jgi:hypothetical protein